MATRKLITYVCDVCEADAPNRYRIGFKLNGPPREVDVCDKHAKGIKDLERALAGGTPTRARRQAKTT